MITTRRNKTAAASTNASRATCECGKNATDNNVEDEEEDEDDSSSVAGTRPCSHKPQTEGRIKRVKYRVRRAGCAMARCTAELAMLHLHWELASECAPCRPRAFTRRLCRRQQSDNELYRSNSFKFERFERSRDEYATPLKKQVCFCYKHTFSLPPTPHLPAETSPPPKKELSDRRSRMRFDTIFKTIITSNDLRS